MWPLIYTWPEVSPWRTVNLWSRDADGHVTCVVLHLDAPPMCNWIWLACVFKCCPPVMTPPPDEGFRRNARRGFWRHPGGETHYGYALTWCIYNCYPLHLPFIDIYIYIALCLSLLDAAHLCTPLSVLLFCHIIHAAACSFIMLIKIISI